MSLGGNTMPCGVWFEVGAEVGVGFDSDILGLQFQGTGMKQVVHFLSIAFGQYSSGPW